MNVGRWARPVGRYAEFASAIARLELGFDRLAAARSLYLPSVPSPNPSLRSFPMRSETLERGCRVLGSFPAIARQWNCSSLIRLVVVALVMLRGGHLHGQSIAPEFVGHHMEGFESGQPDILTASWPMKTLRVFTGKTAWCYLNPSPGVYNWGPLDDWLDQAAKPSIDADILFEFHMTPQWALDLPPATNPAVYCPNILGFNPLGTLPPLDMTDWEDYVTAVVNHSVAYRTAHTGAKAIKYYEMWNEANTVLYWNGTADQMAEMTVRAAHIIHANDSLAKVLTPSITDTQPGLQWLSDFLTAVQTH